VRTIYPPVRNALLFLLLACPWPAYGLRPALEDPQFLISPAPATISVFTLESIVEQFKAELDGEYKDVCIFISALGTPCPPPDPKKVAPLAMEPKTLGGVGAATDVANQIAAFLAERARMELRAWVLDRLRDGLCGSQLKDDSLFPRVCRNAESKDSYALLRMEAELIRAARRDLLELPAFAIWRASSADPKGRQTWGYVVTNFATQVREGQSVESLLRGLAITQAVVDDCAKADRCALYYVGLMAQAYSLVPAKIGTDPTAEIKVIGSDVLKLLHAHVCAQSACSADKKRWLAKARSVATQLVPGIQDVGKAGEVIKQVTVIREQAAIVEAAAKQLQQLRSNPLTPKDELAASLGDLLESSVELSTKLANMLGEPSSTFLGTAQWRGHLSLIKSSMTISAAAVSTQYSKAIETTRELLRCLKPKEAECAPVPFVIEEKLIAAVDGALKNVSFLATIADAKSNREVQALLNEWAAPLGAWRLKRDRALTSVGAVVGGAIGYEWVRVPGDSYNAVVVSPFAPVGLDWS
jgi:hypothetical protein